VVTNHAPGSVLTTTHFQQVHDTSGMSLSLLASAMAARDDHGIDGLASMMVGPERATAACTVSCFHVGQKNTVFVLRLAHEFLHLHRA
jgi:hypothetical protein